jgi:hypothetical protein
MYRYLEIGTINWCYFAFVLELLILLLFRFLFISSIIYKSNFRKYYNVMLFMERILFRLFLTIINTLNLF